MPGMLDVIQKSPVMQRFEFFSHLPGSPSGQKLADAITRLGGDPTLPNNQLLKIAEDLGFYKPANPSDHFRKHWLGLPPDPDPFWPGIQDKVNQVIRAGMLKACETFRDTEKPFEFWWIISGAEGTIDWQMSVTDYGKRTKVIFHTPAVPCDELPQDSTRTWVILEDETGTVVTRRAQVPTGTELPEPTLLLKKRVKRKKVVKKPRKGPRPPKKAAKKKPAKRGKK